MIIALIANIVGVLVSAFVGGILFGVLLSSVAHREISHPAKYWRRFSKHFVLDRAAQNPILAPLANGWEAAAVFNPAALVLGERTHLIYRAIGTDGVSRFGYASSLDGVRFDERLPYPVYAAHDPRRHHPYYLRRYSPIMYPSGGSWGGCEDPRMVLIEGRVYVTHNCFDGWDNLRVGLISIDADDFLHKRWDWYPTKFLSPTGSRAKNWMLFPEKVHGKFALLHNLHAEDADHVRVECVDDIDSYDPDAHPFESPDPQQQPDRNVAWHDRMRSAGPPPIKTPYGWLLFYHATEKDESHRYKLGAMLLDLDDPTRIIRRAPRPVLEPDMGYENDGKPGIVYATGAVVQGDMLYVYYGGGDRTTAVATAHLPTFLDAFMKSEAVVLAPAPTLVQSTP